jgi:hypothetical protein
VTNSRIKTLTATAQQVSILRQQGRYDTTPREAFVKDLTKFIQKKREEGSGILLMGDFNEALDVTYDGMTKMCSKLGLEDIMFQELGQDSFNTYVDGTERIDYVLADPWIADACISACYEPFQFRFKGDHRNMILDFDEIKLFGNPTYNLGTPPSREFSSKDKSANHTYIEHRHQYCVDHHIERRLEALELRWDATLAEKLDQDFQRACHHAAKKCKKKPNIVYVKKLRLLRIKKNVLLKVISQFKTGRNLSDAIAFQVREGHDFTIPETLQECQKACRITQQAIRALEKHAVTHR